MGYNKTITTSISLVVALGGFLLGFDSAVISGAIPFMTEYFDLKELQVGWTVSSFIVGVIVGNGFSGPLSDRFGRKKILLITAVFFAISAVSSALAKEFWFLVIARIIGGVGVGGALLIAPVYIAEISPPAIRGKMVSFNQLNIVIGISAAYFSNYFLLNIGENNWRWMLGVETIPAILYFVFLLFVPNSPRWLARQNRTDEAFSTLNKIGDQVYAKAQLEEIKISLQTEISEKLWPLLKGLFSKKMSYILILALAISFLQQITGINAVLYYAPVIFEKTGIGKDAAFMQAAIVGLTNLVFTILAMAIIDKLGRKPLLIIGSAGLSLSLLTLSLFSYFGKFSGYGVLIAVMVYVASFAVSLGPVLWVFLSEVFPNKYRGIGISLAGLWASVVSFGVTFIFPWEIEFLGKTVTFISYAFFAILTLLFAIFIFPETKGVSLEELEKKLVRE
jgi:sugar porter (SP) family MFS transporter